MRPWAALVLWAVLWAGGARAQWPCSFNSLCWCRPGQISCVAVPLHKLPELSSTGLVHLEVTGTGLRGVESGALDALRLQSLVLSDNRLQSLPDRALNSMAQTLSSLDFGYNEFPDVPFNTLKDLKILNWLNLQNNNIADLAGDWAHLKDSLTSLILTGNSISEIIGDSLHQLKHLNKLDLDKNKITTISKMALPQNLKILNLEDNLLNKFPVDLFPNLLHLQTLNLRGNLIQRISHITFRNHRNMDKLELGDNGLQMWPSNLFNNTLIVRHLSLELNQLKIIPANAFKGMHTVKLVLAYNKIEHLDDEAFHSLEHTLEQLDLEHNYLLTIPSAIMNLRRLKHLYLPSNRISTIHLLPQHVKVLSLNGNLLTSIPKDALRNCSLTHLDMGYNLISYLEEGDFDQWGDSVKTLYLRSNKITRLDAGVFSSLPQLKELSLSFNDIHFVHPEVFVNMSQTLKILEMSLSMYRDGFPEEVLLHLSSLEWLGLDNNNIQSLVVQSLFHLQKLQYLNLEFNRITSIPVGFFDIYKFENVREVYLSYNQLEILETETFHSLPELQILDLTVNRIRNVSSSSFRNMPKLMHIALFDNLVTDIGESAFRDLPSLFKLELQKNQLTEFSLKVFHNVTDIEIPFLLNISRNQIVLLDGSGTEIFIDTLDTAHNRLADTPTSFLSKIAKRLKRCILSFNEIGNLETNSFENLDVLEILNLDHNYISTIRRRAFLGLKQLQILDLSHNRIEQLSVEQFSNLNNLRFLNLRRNHIRTLPRDVFKNTMLEHLDLSINEFIILPSMAFSQVGFTLRYLDISHNSISSVDTTLFQETPFLLSLDLSDNRLTTLSDNIFNSLGNLQYLDISSNSIRANFKELLHYLPVLKYLSLSNVGLKVFPFIPLRNLTSLNLTFNFIEHAKEIAVKNMVALRYLYLKGNSLTSVPSHIWQHTPKLKFLDLSKNPIQSLNENSFLGLERLENLDICNLHKLKHFDPGTLSTLKSLTSLRTELRQNIKDLHLGNIVSEVEGLKVLQINVKEEYLEYQLNGVFVPKLKELAITGEDLVKISVEAFEGADRLYELSVAIRDTSIKKLPVGILDDLGKVSQLALDLSGNQLESLSPDTFYPNSSTWEKLATKLISGGLSIYSNPLPCDCDVAWLARWVRRWAREVGPAGRAAPAGYCSRGLAERPLLRLHAEDLRCHASALAAAAPVHGTAAGLAALGSLVLARIF